MSDRIIKRSSFPFEIKELVEDGDFYFFKGYASTFGNVDLVGDVVVPGAFLASLAKRKPILLWQHDRDDPIGVFPVIYEDTKGLYVEGKMPKSDTLVQGRVYPQLKTGSVAAMSIGYSVKDFELKDGICYLKELDLFEISLVTFPANPSAVVSSVKSIDEISSEREAENFLSQFLSSNKSKHFISKMKKLFGQREVDSKDEKQLDLNRDDLKKIANDINSILEGLRRNG